MKLKQLLVIPFISMFLVGCDPNASLPDYQKVDTIYTFTDFAKYSGYMSVSPSLGESKLLVIPVWFTDSSDFIANKDNVRNDIETAYIGTSEETGWESVCSYYAKDSFGRVKLDATVSSWYECGKPSSDFYTSGDNTSSLVYDAVKWYKEAYQVSALTEFDKDQNGYIDGVILIYAAPDFQAAGKYSRSNMWAYTSWLGKTFAPKKNPVPNVFFWASYDFMYSSDKAVTRTGLSEYANGDTRYCNIDTHTYIHEMGHVFGAYDYYDYDHVSCAAGGFSMQDLNVGGHDPYSRLALGWVDALVPNRTTSITVKPVEEGGEIIILSPNYIGSPFDEYIILELYTPTGLNQFDSEHLYDNRGPLGPSRAGVRVWHVDGRLISVNTRTYEIDAIVNEAKNPGSSHFLYHATNNNNGDTASTYGGNAYYNELELIKNDVNEEYSAATIIDEDSLFYTGDTFSVKQFRKQFVNGTRLNNKKALGWEVTFDSVTEDEMTVTLIKTA